MEEELLVGIEGRLTDRIQVLGDKALVVRARLDHLLAALDSAEDLEPGAVIGPDGEDIDFLIADVLTLRSLIDQLRSQIAVVRRAEDPSPTPFRLHILNTAEL